jgi:hypothetical protein
MFTCKRESAASLRRAFDNVGRRKTLKQNNQDTEIFPLRKQLICLCMSYYTSAEKVAKKQCVARVLHSRQRAFACPQPFNTAHYCGSGRMRTLATVSSNRHASGPDTLSLTIPACAHRQGKRPSVTLQHIEPDPVLGLEDSPRLSSLTVFAKLLPHCVHQGLCIEANAHTKRTTAFTSNYTSNGRPLHLKPPRRGGRSLNGM